MTRLPRGRALEHVPFVVDQRRLDAEERPRRGAGLELGGARQRRDENAAGLGLPPGVDDRAAAVADHAVIPLPRLGIDRLAHRAQQPQRGAVGALARSRRRRPSARGSPSAPCRRCSRPTCRSRARSARPSGSSARPRTSAWWRRWRAARRGCSCGPSPSRMTIRPQRAFTILIRRPLGVAAGLMIRKSLRSKVRARRVGLPARALPGHGSTEGASKPPAGRAEVPGQPVDDIPEHFVQGRVLVPDGEDRERRRPCRPRRPCPAGGRNPSTGSRRSCVETRRTFDGDIESGPGEQGLAQRGEHVDLGLDLGHRDLAHEERVDTLFLADGQGGFAVELGLPDVGQDRRRRSRARRPVRAGPR